MHKDQISTSLLFSIGFCSILILGGLVRFFFGNGSIDIQLHDTYFVIAYSQILMALALCLGLFACIYYVYPKIFGRKLNEVLGKIHFGITTLGMFGIILSIFLKSMQGVHRRYYSFDGLSTNQALVNLNQITMMIAFLILMTQLLFVFNFFFSFWKGKSII